MCQICDCIFSYCVRPLQFSGSWIEKMERNNGVKDGFANLDCQIIIKRVGCSGRSKEIERLENNQTNDCNTAEH